MKRTVLNTALQFGKAVQTPIWAGVHVGSRVFIGWSFFCRKFSLFFRVCFFFFFSELNITRYHSNRSNCVSSVCVCERERAIVFVARLLPSASFRTTRIPYPTSHQNSSTPHRTRPRTANTNAPRQQRQSGRQRMCWQLAVLAAGPIRYIYARVPTA